MLALAGVSCDRGPDLTPRQLRVEQAAIRKTLHAPKAVDRFYEARRYEPAWTDESDREAMRAAIAAVADEGLEPARYHAGRLAGLEADIEAPASKRALLRAAARRDVLLTDAFVRLGSDLAAGRLDARTLTPLGIALPAAEEEAAAWNRLPPGPPLEDRLEAALPADDVAGALDELRPQTPYYASLRAELRRLTDRDAEEPEVERRVAALAANLERERWMPAELGDRHVEVDIPGFALRLMVDGEIALESRIVVGKPDGDETPLFTSRIEHLVLNPTWTVPKSILVEELAPQIREEPERLLSGFRVFQRGEEIEPEKKHFKEKKLEGENAVTLVQDPGPGNPLGRVKFPLPGTPAIYLHDTPSRSLFREDLRAASHGCIRVEKAWTLAAELAGESERELERRAKSGREKWLSVDEPIPVHTTYRTVVLDESGGLVRRPDPYRFDDRIFEALAPR